MPYAVILTFEPSLAEPVEAMSRAISDYADQRAPVPPYRPHVTLAVYAADMDGDCMGEDGLRTAVEAVSEGWRGLDVTLAGFGAFPGSPSYLWLVPVVVRDMLDLHRELHGAVPQARCHPHYHLGGWVPHVTLQAVPPSMVGQAMDVLQAHWTGPLRGVVNRVEFVRFAPVEFLWGRDLPPAARAAS